MEALLDQPSNDDEDDDDDGNGCSSFKEKNGLPSHKRR
jgi:hypothetical protein